MKSDSIGMAEVANLAPFVDFLASSNIPTVGRLERAGIDPEMVETGRGKITKSQLYSIIERAARDEGIPDFGYRAAASFGPAQMGGLGQAMLAAPTLKGAIEVFAAHVNGWVDHNEIWLELEGSDVWLCNRSLDGYALERDVIIQATVALFTNIVRSVAGAEWTPERVRVEMRANRVHARVALVGESDISFDPEVTAIAFPSSWLARSMPIHSPVGAQPIPLPGPKRFQDSLAIIIKNHLALGAVPRIDEATTIADVPIRTLQRRLASEGLSYRTVVDRVRLEEARRLLTDPRVRSEDLAMALGYSKTGNFLRAFRRITGTTPREYRRTVLGMS